jgi:hypothetical protein
VQKEKYNLTERRGSGKGKDILLKNGEYKCQNIVKSFTSTYYIYLNKRISKKGKAF